MVELSSMCERSRICDRCRAGAGPGSRRTCQPGAVGRDGTGREVASTRAFAFAVRDPPAAEHEVEVAAAVDPAYVRFAGTHRPLFEMLFEAGLDKDRHPEVKAAEKPIDEAFLGCVRAISDANETRAANLATAIEATAHGHARLLLDRALGHGEDAIGLAADRAARATLALVESRRLLG
jgi:Tetracyclin repressor-like, C-terminal domain